MRSLPLGRLFGVPLYLSPSWLLLAVPVTAGYGAQLGRVRPQLGAVAAYTLAAALVAGLLLSVLLHELGHALAGRRLGTGVRGITLELLGGYTELERDAPGPRTEALVSLAGPAVSAALAGVCGAAAAVAGPGHGARFLAQLAFANAVIAGFNLLPGLPLDGGRALQAGVWALTGDPHRGRRIAGHVGTAVAGLLVVATVVLSGTGRISLLGAAFTLVVAWSVGSGGVAAVRAGRAGSRLHLLSVDALARPIFGVPAGTTLGEAYRLAATVAGAVPSHRPGGLVLGVVAPDGRLWAVVPEAEDTAVAADRRDSVAVDSVARLVEAYRCVPAGLTGAAVLHAVEDDPVGDYLVVAGEDVSGILRVADIARVLDPCVSASARTVYDEERARD